MNHQEFVELLKKYDGDLRVFLPLIECEADAWRAAALISKKGKDKDPLVQNAKCVSVARYLAFRDEYQIKYDRAARPFSFIKDGRLVDHKLKGSMSYETSLKMMYSKVDVASVYHLSLGSAFIHKQDISTLVDVAYNRDLGHAVFLKGNSIVIVGEIPKNHEIPWTDYPHSVITAKELLQEGAWSGKLVFST
jgi:hypothetical protein